MHQTKELEGNSKKKRLTIPETSSEEPLEHSETANSKNSFFSYSDIHTKNKNNPNQNQNEDLNQKLDGHESDKDSENFCQEIKNATIQEPTTKTEWGNTNISQSSGQKQKPKELAYQVNEMQVQKLEKGIFIGDSAATSHMTSDMTGLYNLQKISSSVMIGNGQNMRCTRKGLLDVIVSREMDQQPKTHGKLKWFHN